MRDEIKTEAEFLRSAALDIVTLEPLEDSARAEVYAIDARRIAAKLEALEARAEKAEAERDAAIAALSEEGRRRGEAEAKRDALRKALGQILTLDRGIPPEVTDSALDAWWSNLCAQYREIARAALNREPDT